MLRPTEKIWGVVWGEPDVIPVTMASLLFFLTSLSRAETATGSVADRTDPSTIEAIKASFISTDPA